MQSLALVRTTKINRKIIQTNTKKNKIQQYTTYIHMHTNVILTKDAYMHNLTIPIQN